MKKVILNQSKLKVLHGSELQMLVMFEDNPNTRQAIIDRVIIDNKEKRKALKPQEKYDYNDSMAIFIN